MEALEVARLPPPPTLLQPLPSPISFESAATPSTTPESIVIDSDPKSSTSPVSNPDSSKLLPSKEQHHLDLPNHHEIMRAAVSSNLKPVSLELGSNSPVIIFYDADVNKAAELALLGIVFNKGEICVAGSRVLVQEGIYDEFEKKLVEKAKAWVVGDPFDPKVQKD
ncbi:hypothetical protein V8G54_023389 [Vigna mungo]|uniref:Aldehyde dehydrogenase domain-containing protein n=1 Tax=Vigna mungo TaxID=3915 RepID=A0AAQ3RRJ1_VIGMU